MTHFSKKHSGLPKLPVMIAVLCLIAGCASMMRITPATLVESEGPSAGSLVTMTVDGDRAIPPVGAIGTLSVLTRADDTALGNLPLTNVTFGLAAGTVEVVEVSGRILTVRISEPKATIGGEPVDLLNEPGKELVLEWRQPPN